MAKSNAHRWGQIIGEAFEAFVHDMLKDVAERHHCYLDSKGPRPARGKGVKVTWSDISGNAHDLDYVIERGGSANERGVPVAFIESAWRRYTKHSKNKVQEIEAAVVPVTKALARFQPFCGAVLAGDFTASSIRQLQSSGFVVLHIPYESILAAFAQLGIDAGSSDGEGTSEAEFLRKIRAWGRLPQPAATARLARGIGRLHEREVEEFMRRLDASLARRVSSVRLAVLRGYTVECAGIEEAVAYLVEEAGRSMMREDGEERESFEVAIRFSNGARCEATFPTREEAVVFLRGFS